MKIVINNLGPIHCFEFDLSKDLNVIFGKNNIGKSYAITAVYLLIKNLIANNYRSSIEYDFYMFRNHYRNDVRNIPKIFKEISEIENQIINKLKEKKDLNITTDIQKLLTKLIEQRIKEDLEKSFKNSFSSIDGLINKFNAESFSIDVYFKDFTFSILIDKSRIYIDKIILKKDLIIRPSVSNRKQIEDSKSIIVYYNQKVKKKGTEYHIIDRLILNLYLSFSSEVSEEINNIYFLPASRSGLYQALSTFNAVIAELSKSRTLLSNKIELPNISEPVIDYFLYLANINNKKISKKHDTIVSTLEDTILQGSVSFNTENKKIVFEPYKINTELDLAFTSSMISEIAPIVAFLKYIINDEISSSRSPFQVFEKSKSNKTASNLIFIEEPEAHLHPEVQVKMMELFAELSKQGVKIVMTTHSNYMFGKLSNLILDNKIDFNKVGSYLMRMTEKGSIIDVNSMVPDEEGIRDENFADIAEMLYEERISLYDKLNSNAN